jgi:hypothetical protein
MKFCPKYSRVAWTNVRTQGVFTRLRCGQWSCEYCAGFNAYVWRKFLQSRLPKVSETWYLLTLTADPNKRTAAASLKNIRTNIDALMKRVKRVYGDIDYVRVYEKHPSSEAIHAHLIISGLTPYVAVGQSVKLRPMAIGVLTRKSRNGVWASRTWFKINARDLGMGYIVDVTIIEGNVDRAIWYICKYLTKAQQDLKTKYLRHVQTTKRVGSPDNESSLDWQVGYFITARDFAPNQTIKDLQTGDLIDNAFWERHEFYPYNDFEDFDNDLIK